MPFRLLLALTLLFVLLLATQASAQALKPFKDEFSPIPGIISSEAGGAYLVVDYSEARDINKRDQVPERRVRGEYVSTGVRKVQKDLALKTDAGTIRHFAVGRTEGARIITIYLHGRGGNRKQGVDDFTFGGNFNRIKNLMAANRGLYLSPDFSDFSDKGSSEIAALISPLCRKVAGRENLRRLRLDGRNALLAACFERRSGGPALRPAAAGFAFGRELLVQRRVQAKDASLLRPGQPRHRIPGREAGGFLPFDHREIAGLSGPLRALRDRHARHADPHDGLARDARTGCCRSRPGDLQGGVWKSSTVSGLISPS